MKRHLLIPYMQTTAVCGKDKVDSTRDPDNATCLSCRRYFEQNVEWFNMEADRRRYPELH